MKAGLKGKVSGADLQWSGPRGWMNTGEKELVDRGLNMLRGIAGSGKAGHISAMATVLEGVPFRKQGIGNIGK